LLTIREREVIAALVRERLAHNRTIAEHLNLSEHMLRNHLNSIYGKLGIENRMEFISTRPNGLAKSAS